MFMQQPGLEGFHTIMMTSSAARTRVIFKILINKTVGQHLFYLSK